MIVRDEGDVIVYNRDYTLEVIGKDSSKIVKIYGPAYSIRYETKKRPGVIADAIRWFLLGRETPLSYLPKDKYVHLYYTSYNGSIEVMKMPEQKNWPVLQDERGAYVLLDDEKLYLEYNYISGTYDLPGDITLYSEETVVKNEMYLKNDDIHTRLEILVRDGKVLVPPWLKQFLKTRRAEDITSYFGTRDLKISVTPVGSTEDNVIGSITLKTHFVTGQGLRFIGDVIKSDLFVTRRGLAKIETTIDEFKKHKDIVMEGDVPDEWVVEWIVQHDELPETVGVRLDTYSEITWTYSDYERYSETTWVKLKYWKNKLLVETLNKKRKKKRASVKMLPAYLKESGLLP